MKNDNPVLAGVIGWPIGHTKSPLIHTYWLQQHRIHGYYVPLAIRPENFEVGVRSLRKLGFRGANVTIPYKETIFNMASSISDRAALIGAANTLVFGEDGSIRADNTDGIGFRENIRQYAPDWRASLGPALVLGAGGASRAIVSALLDDGAPEVRIANRTRHKADILKDQFGAKVTVVDWAKSSEATDGTATIVNTTSLGMTGLPPLKIKLNAAPRTALVTDIVYSPLKTDLLVQAEEQNLRTVDGVGMLLHQAVPGFHAWFDIRPEVDSTLRDIVLRG